MKKLNLIILIITFWHYAFAQLSLNKEFTIKGSIKNFSGKNITISYLDNKGKIITDTANVVNGVFYFRGNINEATLASLTGVVKSPSINDPNFTELFLEPNQIEIEIEEEHFKNLQVLGSKTQNEFDVLKKLQKPINDKIDPLNLVFTKVRADYIKLNKPDSLLGKINNLRQEIISLYGQLKPIDINFIKLNPQSYVSAYLILKNIRDLPVDSGSIYYSNLSPQVQSSFIGNLVNQYIISNKNSAVGEVAPFFKLKDINNKVINLADFRNKKYVLLDFWASWCIPCRQSTPTLIKTYNLYKENGLEIISVSIDDNEKAWRAAVLKDKIPWINLLIGSKSSSQSLKTMYNVTPVPTYILIDKKGVIIGKYEGADENLNNELLKQLEKVLIN